MGVFLYTPGVELQGLRGGFGGFFTTSMKQTSGFMQSELKKAGYYTGKIDGLPGAGTRAGINKLLKSVGQPAISAWREDIIERILSKIPDDWWQANSAKFAKALAAYAKDTIYKPKPEPKPKPSPGDLPAVIPEDEFDEMTKSPIQKFRESKFFWPVVIGIPLLAIGGLAIAGGAMKGGSTTEGLRGTTPQQSRMSQCAYQWRTGSQRGTYKAHMRRCLKGRR